MLDTVRLCIRLPLSSNFPADRWKQRTYRYAGETKHSFRLEPRLFDPCLAHVFVDFSERRGDLCVEASLPRLVNGHNIDLLDAASVDAAIARLDALVGWALDGAAVPSVRVWNVRRADLAFNFRSRRFSFDVVRDAYMRLQPSGRMVAHRVGSTSSYFRHAGRRHRKRIEIAIYDKFAETLTHHPKLRHRAADTVRIEVRMFGQAYIARAFGMDVPTFGEVARPERVHAVMLAKIRRLGIEPGLESVITGFESLVERVGPPRARRLWPYVDMRHRMSAKDACSRLRLARETGRRYERELRRLGLYPVAVTVAGVLEEIVQQIGGSLQPVASSRSSCAFTPQPIGCPVVRQRIPGGEVRPAAHVAGGDSAYAKDRPSEPSGASVGARDGRGSF